MLSILLAVLHVTPAHPWVQGRELDRAGAHEVSTLPSCGVACCFVLLRLHGLNPSLPAVTTQLTEVREGLVLDDLSAADLASALRAFGLEVTVWRWNPRLPAASWPVPAILHLPPEHVKAARRVSGHYVVLAEVRSDVAVIIDGSVGQRREVAVADLVQIWQGDMIVARSQLMTGQRQVLQVLALCLLTQIAAALLLLLIPLKDRATRTLESPP